MGGKTSCELIKPYISWIFRRATTMRNNKVSRGFKHQRKNDTVEVTL